MKVFMDAAAAYPDVKVIAIGAVDSARDVIKYDHEMRTRVSEVSVPLMAEEELAEIIKKGGKILNVDFDKVSGKITSYSSGLAAICHQLCLYVCFDEDIVETLDEPFVVSDKQLNEAFNRLVRDASDTLKEVFDVALKRHRSRRFDNTRLILQALSKIGSAGGTHAEILNEIKWQEPGYSASNLTLYLKQLQSVERKSILRFDQSAGRYYFSDPLYLSFARCVFQPASYKVKVHFKLFGIDVSWQEDVLRLIEEEARDIGRKHPEPEPKRGKSTG